VTCDPVLRFVYQPIVDLLDLKPSRASAIAADGFLVCALAMTVCRFVPPYQQHVAFTMMHVVGAIVIHWWMRWCAANGRASLAGILGGMHAIMRTLLLALVVFDVLAIHYVAADPSTYMPGALLRTVIQAAEDLLGASALYLSACGTPPPRRRLQHSPT
jgi:hypothetical protein